MGAENPVTSRDLHILVYEAAEAVSSQLADCRAGRWGSAGGGWLLSERSVRAVSVVVLGELVEHYCEVTRAGDQEMVQAFAA